MAREIVITSVPRGIKLGRTGFQVAMQTAGMRDDVAALLEKMAGYRHLPAGSGANPVCYFYRLARTFAGQLHVLGRIVDAGVDFSNRSNKLAHMVVVEPAELGQVASSSPAAMLAAIEGRLAMTWPGNPEERQTPFSLAGIPPSQPAPCGTWQHVMGDAGWAGVIADRAIHNQPTLLVGPDPSPASCRRMLALFEEALAILPPAKRWAVTFDTLSLSADGILWRGTYAGSPESQASQPGLLMVDLTRPQPIPSNMAAGELVDTARTGRGPRTGPTLPTPRQVTRGPTPPNAPVQSGGPVSPMALGGMPPPPPEDEWVDVPLSNGSSQRRSSVGIWIALAVVAVVVLVGVAGVGGFVAWNLHVTNKAWASIQGYADSKSEAKKPTIEDFRTALGAAPGSQDANLVAKHLDFLLEVLASDGVKGQNVNDSAALRNLLDAIEAVKSGKHDENHRSLLGAKIDEPAAQLLAEVHKTSFNTYADFQSWATACSDLVKLASIPEGQRTEAAIDDELWDVLERQAKADTVQRDYVAAKTSFPANVKPEDVQSLATLVPALREHATKLPEPGSGEPNQDLAGADDNSKKRESAKKTEAEKQAAAFQEFQRLLKNERTHADGRWPLDQDVISATDALEKLDAEVVVGKTKGFDAKAQRDAQDPKKWNIMVDDKCLAVVELTGGGVKVRKGNCDDTVFNKYESLLKFMPIAFHQPRKLVTHNDWIILGRPEEVKVEQGVSLYSLLYDESDTAPVPSYTLPSGATVAWTPLKRAAGKISLESIRDGNGGIYLKVSELVDGKPNYTLLQRLEIDAKNIRRDGSSWKRRFDEIAGFNEKNVETIKDTNKVVASLLSESSGSSVVPNAVIPLCEMWRLKDPKILESLQDILQAFLVMDHDVEYGKAAKELKEAEDKKDGGAIVQATAKLKKLPRSTHFRRRHVEVYDKANAVPEGGDAGAFREREPSRKKDEKDDQYNKRRKDWEDRKRDYELAWKKWIDAREDYVVGKARALAELRTFLDKHDWGDAKVGDKTKPEPELAAIHVLLAIDGLVVAKKHREELKKLLSTIPIGALFEGNAAIEWDVPGLKEKVKTSVARLVLAPVPAPSRSPDLKPATELP